MSTSDRAETIEKGEDSDAGRHEILQLICTEIARDGGASLVTTLKEYLTPKILSKKRFRALLIAATGIPKLLTLLESFPDLFHVDRNTNPHWVILRKSDYVNHLELEIKDNGSDASMILSKQQIDLSRQQQLVVYNKALYTLRKRQSKLDRRKQRDDIDKTATEHQQDCCFDNDDDEELKVNTFWLLQQCKWDVHFYLRSTGFYRKVYSKPEDVQLLGSLAWEKIVLNEFESILSSILYHEEQQEPESTIAIENSKAWLKSQSKPLPSRRRESNHGSNSITVATEASKSIDETKDDNHYLQKLDKILTKAVDEDGSIQIRLELLLHRHTTLKNILGGRDLWRIIQDCRQKQNNEKATVNSGNLTLFRNIDIQREGADVILQSTTIDKTNIGRRMRVDEVGLFSITNSKWGTAVANMMVQSVYKVGWVSKEKPNPTENSNEEANETTCASAAANAKPSRTGVPAIDLTASVGGMTLGIARTNFFRPIIAIEIDPTRARLCQENMIQHGFAQDVVEVRPMDSMDAIPTLPSRSCIVLDPPWGGISYNKIQRENMKNLENSNQQMVFQMGKWTLEDILEKVSLHLKPCIVGLRLPITLIVDDFLDNLRQNRRLVFDKLFARKLSVQVFVVIFFPEEDDAKAIKTEFLD